jgi:excisionase family DNA binding protein
MDVIYTPAEVAERLKLPVKTVLNYLRTGKLPGFRVGKHWRIKASDLESFTKPQLRLVEANAAEETAIERINTALGQDMHRP